MTTFANGESGLSVRTKINNVLQHADGTAGELVINEAGADVDFRVESDTNANALFVDGATGNVGIGTSSVSSAFGTTVKVFSSGNGGTLDVGGSTVNARLFGSEGLSIAGFGTSTNHPFTLFTNDTERLRVDSSGNVGIGTSSPYTKLDIVQATAGHGGWKYGASLNATDFPALRFLATTGNTGSIIAHEAGATVFLTGTTATGAGTERMRIGSSGNVGIGTSSPYSRFTVVPASNPVTPTAANQITIGEASGNAAYAMHVGYFLESGAYKGSIQATSGAAPSTLVLNGDGGNVGVGTSSPAAKLHSSSADGGAYSFGLNGTTKGLRVIHNSTGTAIQGVDATLSATYEPLSIGGSYTTITTSSLERLRIDSSGNVGIGTSAPTNKLTVAGGIDFSASAFSGSGTGIWSPLTNELGLVTAGSTRLRIDASGNVGVGVVPSVWNAAFKAIEFGSGNINSISIDELNLSQNAYYGASTWQYKASSGATQYRQSGSVHRWFTAPSGTAGNQITFTQTMTLDASGNLLIGTTSSGGSKLRISGLPTSSAGLSAGDVWNDGGTLKIA